VNDEARVAVFWIPLEAGEVGLVELVIGLDGSASGRREVG
jgi:hypothetical protein